MSQLSAKELRSQLETVIKHRSPQIVALSSGAAAQVETVECNGRLYQVRQIRSVLEFYDQVDQALANDLSLVCLTELDDHDLGLDLRCRLHKRRILSVDAWTAVRHLFDCQAVEPSLAQQPHLAKYLLSLQPVQGYAKVKGDVLTVQKVWSCLFEFGLGLPGDYLDALALLQWAGGDCRAYLEAPADLKASAQERIETLCHDFGRVLLATVEDGRHHPLAVGLALRCLAVPEPDPDQKMALVRLEQYTGGEALEPKVLQDWAGHAEHLYSSEPNPDPEILQQAERLLADLQVSHLAVFSNFLPSGLEQRLGVLGQRLQQALETPSGATSVEEAVNGCLAHHQVDTNQRQRLEMLPRLLRWLHTAASEPGQTLEQLSQRYAYNTGFADWARLRAEGTESQPQLARALEQLILKVVERLEDEAEQFAETLAAWNSAGEPELGVWKVEQVIDRVLAPLMQAKGGRFLLVVLDGCSWATLHELLETFPLQNWRPLRPENLPSTPAVLATYPSITECSRTSLLSGALVRGNAATESKNFREHPALRGASAQGYPPVLFHKGDLDSGFKSLAAEVDNKITNPKVKAVAVVLNAIDDHLEKDDQLRRDWDFHSLHYLNDLVTLAHRSGRVLVLASDHGHVLERGSELRKGEGGGARWQSGRTPKQGEVVLSGPRVLSDDKSVVLVYSEKLRYTMKKNGYHGGCHPRELLAPLLVLAPADVNVPGWQETQLEKPSWWAAAARPKPAPRRRYLSEPPAPKEPDTGQLTLFEPAEPVSDSVGLAEAVLSFPLVAEQWSQQKSAPSQESAARLLTYLEEAGGRATVTRLSVDFGVHETRFRQLLTELAPLLSVDGQHLVSLTPDAQTVMLNQRALDNLPNVEASGCVIEVERSNGDYLSFSVPLPSLSKQERLILEKLAQYGQLPEAELRKLVGSRRVAGTIEKLMERLNKAGFPHLTQSGEGAGGRNYRLNVTAL